MREAILEVRGLHKQFVIHAIGRLVPALRGVDLSVAPGEHVALVGRSGAGKSTLLKCVWRSCLPSAGEIRLRRRDESVTDLASADDRAIIEVRRDDLAYVSQFLRPDGRRTVLQVVGRAAIRHGLEPAAATAAAAAALRRVGLAEELWGTQPVVLSGGEQQRVNLAAGTLGAPRLLLLDEPVAALDSGHRDTVFGIIRELGRAGVSVLSVFHDTRGRPGAGRPGGRPAGRAGGGRGNARPGPGHGAALGGRESAGTSPGRGDRFTTGDQTRFLKGRRTTMVVQLLSNVRAVVGGHIVEAATVATEDGRILSIEENRSYAGAIDGRGAFCLPGLVDSHCDALEREVSPRPTVSFDLEFALRSLEARFLGAGITTACHGVNFFGEGDRMRSPEMATRLVDVVAARRAAGARIDHRVLFRIPARTTDSVDRAIACLPGGQPEGDVPLVSFEDHTPGQGQYRDVDQYKAAISRRSGPGSGTSTP